MVNVIIHTDTRYPVNRKVIRRAVLDTFSEFKVESGDLEVSVAVVGSRKMKDLSLKFLKDGKTHEVLAFAQEEISQSDGRGFVNPPDNILRLGDIVLCWPEILKEASRQDSMVDDQLYFLTGHATEHLLGKHHE
ncbi:rRNA maturation RNase YbeY [Candidatus Curtissbacteria bacterium RIFCSPHIGHO2_12_41_11]|uniref:rRNA maturation RNase YbeY n=1 Tax=Candidatus Curtissbacteria bacterium RIFCSPHIGHO2_12_41_11 TaxID=1797718 RepID=A0A1F5H4W4_9BACT|nr:MAG: rRNA maturation RNase YbeY [Candidatus Curtissbacteria bacterium RIFCSPHIGHO2_12_41_11]